MTIAQLLTSGGGALLILLTLIQIAPIKINPWTALARAIGRAINKDVLTKLLPCEKRLFLLAASVIVFIRTAAGVNILICKAYFPALRLLCPFFISLFIIIKAFLFHKITVYTTAFSLSKPL